MAKGDISKAQSCVNDNPCDGYTVAAVEGLGKVTVCMGISPLIKAMSCEKSTGVRGGKFRFGTQKPARVNTWKDIPSECFANGKDGTHGEVYASFYTKETQAPEDISKAVWDAVPQTMREILTTEVKFNSILGEINLDRLMMGDRRFLRRRVQDKQNKPVIGLAVPVQANSHISTEIVSIRSVVCGIAVEILESLGYCVEVYAVAYGQREFSDEGQENGVQCLRIKQAGESMATSTILNATSGWSFRTAFFGMIEYSGAAVTGLGTSRAMSTEEIDLLQAYLPAVDDFLMLNCYPTSNSRKEAIKQAIDELIRCVQPYLE